MYSYVASCDLKTFKDGEFTISPVFDEKISKLFEKRGISKEVTMKDFYAFANLCVELGVAFPNAAGRTARPLLRQVFKKDEPLVIKEYPELSGVIELHEMVASIPMFTAYMNYKKYLEFVKSLKDADEKFSVLGSINSSEISYTDGAVNLFTMLRGMVRGKVAIETPQGVVTFEATDMTANIRETLREDVDTTEAILATANNHTNTIKRHFDKQVDDMKKKVAVERANALKANIVNTADLIAPGLRAGFEVAMLNGHLAMIYHKRINLLATTVFVDHFGIPKEHMADRVTIPLPMSVSKELYAEEIVVYFDDNYRISSIRAKGNNPHIGTGGMCLGDLGGKPIKEVDTVLDSLRIHNFGHALNGSVRHVNEYIERVFNRIDDIPTKKRTKEALSKAIKEVRVEYYGDDASLLEGLKEGGTEPLGLFLEDAEVFGVGGR